MIKKERLVRTREVRAFESDLLERLSRVHPAIPLCVWTPLALAVTWLGVRLGLGWDSVAGLFAVGVVAWTLVEYILHRWFFHWEPEDETLRRAVYPVHQLHHDVQEWDRLVAPPLLAVPIGLIFLLVFWLLLGSPKLFPFFGGFVIGYLAYDYIHFYVHFAKPRSRIGQGLRRRHLQHHFACEERWFGVSSPLWDYVFRTHVARDERPASLD